MVLCLELPASTLTFLASLWTRTDTTQDTYLSPSLFQNIQECDVTITVPVSQSEFNILKTNMKIPAKHQILLALPITA
jgi:hypothetical protein